MHIWTSTLRETRSSPGARCTRGRTRCTRGSLPRCNSRGRQSGKRSTGSRIPRESEIAHSRKDSPRGVKALGEEILFFQKNPKNRHWGALRPGAWHCGPLRPAVRHYTVLRRRRRRRSGPSAPARLCAVDAEGGRRRRRSPSSSPRALVDPAAPGGGRHPEEGVEVTAVREGVEAIVGVEAARRRGSRRRGSPPSSRPPVVMEEGGGRPPSWRQPAVVEAARRRGGRE
jgi:hypothetical protein